MGEQIASHQTVLQFSSVRIIKKYFKAYDKMRHSVLISFILSHFLMIL